MDETREKDLHCFGDLVLLGGRFGGHFVRAGDSDVGYVRWAVYGIESKHSTMFIRDVGSGEGRFPRFCIASDLIVIINNSFEQNLSTTTVYQKSLFFLALKPLYRFLGTVQTVYLSASPPSNIKKSLHLSILKRLPIMAEVGTVTFDTNNFRAR